MPNGITMHGVQASLLDELDHGRIEIDPVGVDAALAQKRQPLPRPGPMSSTLRPV